MNQVGNYKFIRTKLKIQELKISCTLPTKRLQLDDCD